MVPIKNPSNGIHPESYFPILHLGSKNDLPIQRGDICKLQEQKSMILILEYSGTGIRTAAPGWIVPQNGLDAFGKILDRDQ